MYGRRLHLVIDDERVHLLEGLAAKRGASVSALIREAIDIAFGEESSRARRRQALKEILEIPQPSGPPIDWMQELRDSREERAAKYDDA